jgi:uncharacterized repeat protein (TIGR03803 family)
MKFMRTLLSLSCCAGIAGCAAGTGALPGSAGSGSFSSLAKHGQAPFGARRESGSGNTPFYIFQGQPDGAKPWAGLIDVGGTLYGTTSQGGTNNFGAVFSITTGGTENVIYSFKAGKDGEYPVAALTDVDGTLYGTTTEGGKYSDGVVFSVTTSGTEHVLHSFGNGNDGTDPVAALLFHGGTLYGTTEGGGGGAGGTVFSMTKGGKENWVYGFKGGSDGAEPESTLIYSNGALWGTTHEEGGSGAYGTVFKITTSGAETPLHSFTGAPSDGAYPTAGLIAYSGKFYGTTEYGGAYNNDGAVFEVNAVGKESVIHSFGEPSSGDGVNPVAALLNVGGTFYGTTIGNVGRGSGAVFSITPKGAESIVFAFSGAPSCGCPGTPEDGVIDVNGVLYGTTLYYLGSAKPDEGTVFAVPI